MMKLLTRPDHWIPLVALAVGLAIALVFRVVTLRQARKRESKLADSLAQLTHVQARLTTREFSIALDHDMRAHLARAQRQLDTLVALGTRVQLESLPLSAADRVQLRDAGRAWIAEMDGENVGSIMLAKDSEAVARIRLLLVDPKARGLGLGRHLTDECVRFARDAGYRKMTLWTHSVLTAARHIYQQAGFKLMRSEQHESWGRPVVSEHWDLEL